MNRARVTLAMLAAIGLGTLMVAAPATAEELPDIHYATGAWALQDWEGPYPDVENYPAELSEASCDEVVLAKPDTPAEPVIYAPTGNGDIGTSYETTDLALAVEAGDVISVEYELSHVDNALAGAVRMFAYDSVGADTLNVAPTFGPAIAPTSGTTGTLVLPFAADDTIGTFGLTYDASNDTEGTVTWTNLQLEHTDGEQKIYTPISFCPKPVEPTTTTVTVTTTTTAPGRTLADTGMNTFTLVLVSLVIIAGGVLLVGLTRRRRSE